jgi:aspartyl/asparaginyl beta-hydroxylase (cupin superfamily)
VRLIESSPNVTTDALSIRDPETTIKPHIGDTNAIARCHLGLMVPASLPECGIRVAGQERVWEQGRVLIFCDAHPHTAWNHTTERRVILFVDEVRPE